MAKSSNGTQWQTCQTTKSKAQLFHYFQIFGSTYRKGEKGKYQLVVSKKRWETLKAKFKAITCKAIPMSFDERIYKLNQVVRGWINYFKFANINLILKKNRRMATKSTLLLYLASPEKNERKILSD